MAKGFEWEFTPDQNGIDACKGAVMPCTSGYTYPDESTAIWYGKRWMKETGRTGTVKAIPAHQKTSSYVLYY